MQMTMNTLCPPGRKLGQLAVILKGGWVGREGIFQSAIAYAKFWNSTYAQAKLNTEK